MLRGERGSALVAAVGALSMMTLLAAMSLMAGGADLVISTRLARERSTFYAAESALETTMTELVSGGGLIPAASLTHPWPPPGTAVRRWQDGEWEFSRRICLLPDGGNADGDPDTTVVLFNRGFGYAGSPLERGGSPVFQVLVTAQGGESRQAIVAEVTPVICAPRIAASWTAAGPLDLAGSIRIEAAEHFPAFAGRSPARLLDGAFIEGEPGSDPRMPLFTGVLDVLNAGGTLARLDDIPEPLTEGDLEGLRWSRTDYSGTLEGKGVFIVHNPAFDPAKHEASRIALESGVLAESHDPAYSHLDPSRRPARLNVSVGGAFAGVIIADALGSATAPLLLTGALVTLTRAPQALTATAPLRVVGSREAIDTASRGAVSHKVGFRPIALATPPTDHCP